MKKFIAVLGLATIMTMTSFGQVVKIDGEVKQVESIIDNGRTMVKLRDISNILGYKVDYDNINKTIKLTKDIELPYKEEFYGEPKYIELTFSIKGNKNDLVIKEFKKLVTRVKGYSDSEKDRNGIKVIDVPAKVINGVTYIPIRYVTEQLGYKVSMNENKELILEKAPN